MPAPIIINISNIEKQKILACRYKDDLYDRLWEPYSGNQWTQLSSTFSNDDLIQNDYKLPAVVMNTAATPINAGASLNFYWDADNVTEQYYVYLHFSEDQNLAANETQNSTST